MSEQDDKPLAPWLRAALLSEGLDAGPSEAQKQRMAGKLALAVGLPAAALLGGPTGGGTPPSDGGAGGAAGAAGGAVAGSKPIAAIIGALAVGGAVGVTVSELRPREQAVVHQQPTTFQRDATPVEPDAAPTDAQLVDALIDAAAPTDARADDMPRRDAGRPRADASTATATTMTADELARERELIDIARSALRRNDLRLATKSLVEHTLRYPRGALVQEQRVLSIELAIAKGDQPGAAQQAAAFRRDFPTSVFRKRVDELVPP